MKLKYNNSLLKIHVVISVYILSAFGCVEDTQYSLSALLDITYKTKNNIVLFNSTIVNSEDIGKLDIFNTKDVRLIDIKDVDILTLEKVIDDSLGNKLFIFGDKGVGNVFNLEHDGLKVFDVDTSRINNAIRLHNAVHSIIDVDKTNLDSIIERYSIYELYLVYSALSERDSINKLKLATRIWTDVTQEQKIRYAKELLDIFKTINLYSKNNFLEFSMKSISFGEIKHDTVVSAVVYFTNIGKEPTIINSIESDCSCTVPAYPKYPILPEQQDSLIITFRPNSIGKSSKEIVIKSMYNSPVHIRIEATIK